MVFVISKLNVLQNEVSIISVVFYDTVEPFLQAYKCMLDSCREYLTDPNYSLKIINDSRVLVYRKGYLGNTLEYVYEINSHGSKDEDKTEENSEA